MISSMLRIRSSVATRFSSKKTPSTGIRRGGRLPMTRPRSVATHGSTLLPALKPEAAVFRKPRNRTRRIVLRCEMTRKSRKNRDHCKNDDRNSAEHEICERVGNKGEFAFETGSEDGIWARERVKHPSLRRLWTISMHSAANSVSRFSRKSRAKEAIMLAMSPSSVVSNLTASPARLAETLKP